MTEPVKISIKWCDAERKGPDETDLIRMLDEVVETYLESTELEEGLKEAGRAVDWLQSKYGTKR